jgi:hypothetical protein
MSDIWDNVRANVKGLNDFNNVRDVMSGVMS